MNTKNTILSAIDELHDLDYYAEMNVLESMVDVYCKACMILENCDDSTDISDFKIFQEGYYMEDGEEGDSITKTEDGGYKINNSDQTYYKDKGFRRMKDDGSGLENIVWSILAAIPRMIIAAINSMIGKEKSPEQTQKEINDTKNASSKLKQSGIGEAFGNAVNTLTELCKNHPAEIAIGTAATGGATAGLIALVNHFKKRAKNELDIANVFKNLQTIVSKDPIMKKFIIIDEFNAGKAFNFKYNANTCEITTEVNVPALIIYYSKLTKLFNDFSEYLSNKSFINTDSDIRKDFNKNDDSINIIEKMYKDADIQPFKLFSDKELFKFSLSDALDNFKNIFEQGKQLEESMKKVGSQMEELKKSAKEKKSDELGNSKNLRRDNEKRINNIDATYAKTLQTHVSLVGELNKGIDKIYSAIVSIFVANTELKFDPEFINYMQQEIANQVDEDAKKRSIEQMIHNPLSNDGWTEEEIDDASTIMGVYLESLPYYLEAFNTDTTRQQYMEDQLQPNQKSKPTEPVNPSPDENPTDAGSGVSDTGTPGQQEEIKEEIKEESYQLDPGWSITFNG